MDINTISYIAVSGMCVLLFVIGIKMFDDTNEIDSILKYKNRAGRSRRKKGYKNVND